MPGKTVGVTSATAGILIDCLTVRKFHIYNTVIGFSSEARLVYRQVFYRKSSFSIILTAFHRQLSNNKANSSSTVCEKCYFIENLTISDE